MKRFFSLLLTLLILLTASSCTQQIASPTTAVEETTTVSKLPAGNLAVHFIDVGQGDCTLLESDGEFVLIDAGESEYGERVLSYMGGHGASELKYVIATHPHADHVGGLSTVINNVVTENFITVETDCATKTWRKVLTAVDNQNVNYIDAEVGDTYSFGSARFTIMAPLSDDYSGYNSYSVTTKVECGEISFMLTGDAEKDSEYEMVASGEALSADVLKCGHHGSSTSTTAKFLKAVNPAYAIISCGENNEYGHPHRETMQKLNTLGCEIYRTDTMGTIIATTDGKNLTFSTDKTENSSYTYSAGEQAHSPSPDGYIGNKNSRIFHNPACNSVEAMSEKNKVNFKTRQDAANAGYTPCANCNP